MHLCGLIKALEVFNNFCRVLDQMGAHKQI